MSFQRPPSIAKVLADHHEWVVSEGTRGVRLDLRGADLREADLQGADLEFSLLNGARLRNASMRGIDVRGADLSYAKADSRTKFLHSNLDRLRPDPSKGRGR